MGGGIRLVDFLGLRDVNKVIALYVQCTISAGSLLFCDVLTIFG